MNISTDKIVSISEANRNFSKVARMTEDGNAVFIFKNNKPKYMLIDLESYTEFTLTDEEKIDLVAARVMKKYHEAFEELAK